jgi:hypothetical protein
MRSLKKSFIIKILSLLLFITLGTGLFANDPGGHPCQDGDKCDDPVDFLRVMPFVPIVGECCNSVCLPTQEFTFSMSFEPGKGLPKKTKYGLLDFGFDAGGVFSADVIRYSCCDGKRLLTGQAHIGGYIKASAQIYIPLLPGVFLTGLVSGSFTIDASTGLDCDSRKICFNGPFTVSVGGGIASGPPGIITVEGGLVGSGTLTTYGCYNIDTNEFEGDIFKPTGCIQRFGTIKAGIAELSVTLIIFGQCQDKNTSTI